MPAAVILAAGGGSRMGISLPKSLLEVCGRTLLDRHLDLLLPLWEVTLVGGFEFDRLVAALPACVRIARNPDWRTTGTLASLATAIPDEADELLVIHADLRWAGSMLEKARRAEGDIVIPVDRSPGGPEAMKVEARAGRVTGMSKDVPEDGALGESMGMFLFRETSVRTLARRAGAVLAADRLASVDDLVVSLSTDFRVCVADVTGERWDEIDTPEDLERANRV